MNSLCLSGSYVAAGGSAPAAPGRRPLAAKGVTQAFGSRRARGEEQPVLPAIPADGCRKGADPGTMHARWEARVLATLKGQTDMGESGGASVNSVKVSAHYTGGKGEAYASGDYWSDLGHPSSGFEADFFAPYVHPSHRVLDFGCGNGGLMNALRCRVASIEGLEVNPAAAQRGRDAGFTIYDGIGSIPAGKRYDRILSNHVLEHIRDVCSTLEALQQHLAPEGRFVFKLPIDDFRDRRQRNWTEADVDHHLQTWTPRLFGNVLKESGLAPVEMRVISSAIHPRVFFLKSVGLHRLAFRLLAILGRRRQLFVMARRLAESAAS